MDHSYTPIDTQKGRIMAVLPFFMANFGPIDGPQDRIGRGHKWVQKAIPFSLQSAHAKNSPYYGVKDIVVVAL